MIKFQPIALALVSGLLLGRVMADEAFDFSYNGPNRLTLSGWPSHLGEIKAGTVVLANRGGKPAIKISGSGSNPVAFSSSCALQFNTEYLFQAKVRSDCAVVFKLAGLAMSYNDLGRWQTVVGLCRIRGAADTVLSCSVTALGSGRSPAAEISEISLVQVKRPALAARRSFSGSTPLVRSGAAVAAIVIPAANPEYAELARSIAAAVKRKTGASLPIVSDSDATEPAYPVLLPAWRRRPLILLGRLGNNRALWAAYGQSLTAVDGFYPGGDGYAVHTAANVFRTGVNHLIIGGTSDAGVRAGVGRFLQSIAAAPVQNETLSLPWLQAIKLQGECLESFKTDDARWERKPESPLLPKHEAGYGNIARWYDNAMGYYLTGWDSYRRRERQDLKVILDEHAITHQYLAEFLVRVYRMVDESGLLSPDETRRMDSLIAGNFLDFETVSDLIWMPAFSPPYPAISVVNRHQISPWLADYKMAEFVGKTLTPTGGLRALADFRREEKERMFDSFVTHRSGPSLPGGLMAECYDEIPAAFFRYALDRELYAQFFGSGNARRALMLERVNPASGALAFPAGVRDSKYVLGIVASLTRNPEYTWLWRHLPELIEFNGYFESRYLGPALRYNPDAAAPEAVPISASGFRFAPNPTDEVRRQLTNGKYQFCALVQGYGARDDYLGLNGITSSLPSGTIASLASRGETWLENGGFGNTRDRFDYNTAYASRTDPSSPARTSDDSSQYLGSASLVSRASLRIRQLLSSDIEWTRDVAWAAPGRFAFRDRFTARADGSYALGSAWHPAGVVSDRGGRYVFTLPKAALGITFLGAGFTAFSAPEGDRSTLVSLHHQTLRFLRRGESATSYAVLQAIPAGGGDFAAVELQADGRVALGSGAERTVLDWTADSGAQPVPGWSGRPASRSESPIPVHDLTAQWDISWKFDRMLQPAPIDGKTVAGGIVDFGRIVTLAEIRAVPPVSMPWTSATLPTIWLATEPGAWRIAKGRSHWRPSVRSSNYGEAHPEPRADETLFVDSLPARYVRAEPAAKLRFFTDSVTQSRHTLRLQTGDFLGDGTRQTLVATEVFPQFPRPLRGDDASVALLDARGHAIFQLRPEGPVQTIRLLNWKRGGKPQLFILYASGVIEAYDLSGSLLASADLYRMQTDFDRRYNDRHTRQPAGGFVMPYSIGLWRANASGDRHIVVGRYGGFSFLNPDFSFEGVLGVSGYAVPGLLAAGADFAGTGQEDQVSAERFRLWQIGGPSAPTVHDPAGAKFWPEVYELRKSLREGTEGMGQAPLAGPPIVSFEVLPRLSVQPRYVLLARGAVITLYDAREEKIAAEWRSAVPVSGVGIVKQELGKLHLLVSTADTLLWHLAWNRGLHGPPETRAEAFPDQIASLHEIAGAPGAAVIAGKRGIYLWDGTGGTNQIAAGDFADAQVSGSSAGRVKSVVGATRRGQVISFCIK